MDKENLLKLIVEGETCKVPSKPKKIIFSYNDFGKVSVTKDSITWSGTPSQWREVINRP